MIKYKKAGRFPIRTYEGPTKNLLPDDRETPSRNEGTMPLLVFLSGSKRFVFKLGRFSRTFAEITDGMSLGNSSRWGEDRFQTTIYTLSKENQEKNPLFLCFFSTLRCSTTFHSEKISIFVADFAAMS